MNTHPSELRGLYLLLHLFIEMLLGRVNVGLALRNEDIQRHGRDLYLLALTLPLLELLHNGQAFHEAVQSLLNFLGRTTDTTICLLEDAVGRLELGHAQIVFHHHILSFELLHSHLEILDAHLVALISGGGLHIVVHLGLLRPIEIGERDVLQNFALVLVLVLAADGSATATSTVQIVLVHLKRLGMLLLRQVDMAEVEKSVGNGVATNLANPAKCFLGLDEIGLLSKDGTETIGGVGVGLVFAEDALVEISGILQMLGISLGRLEIVEIDVAEGEHRICFDIRYLLRQKLIEDGLSRLPITEREMEVADKS